VHPDIQAALADLAANATAPDIRAEAARILRDGGDTTQLIAFFSNAAAASPHPSIAAAIRVLQGGGTARRQRIL
jgi:hypothetical protein